MSNNITTMIRFPSKEVPHKGHASFMKASDSIRASYITLEHEDRWDAIVFQGDKKGAVLEKRGDQDFTLSPIVKRGTQGESISFSDLQDALDALQERCEELQREEDMGRVLEFSDLGFSWSPKDGLTTRDGFRLPEV